RKMNRPCASDAVGNRAAAARPCPCLLTSVLCRMSGALACSRYPPRSKWNILVRTALGGFIRRRGGRGRRRGGRLRGRRLRRALPSAIQEPDPIRDDLGDLPFLAVLGFVGAKLQPAFHRYHPALGHVLADLLRQFPPGHDIDEVRLAVPLLVPERPV